MILDPAFDPWKEVTIGDGQPAPISASFQGAVKIVNRRSDRIILETSLNERGHVVLTEGFLPGWNATLDGRSVPVRRANALFLAVDTPAGPHRLVFTYRPWSALAGMSLSAATAALLLMALARLLLSGERPAAPRIHPLT